MRMTFWNTKNNVSDETLATLVETTATDVLVLAEYRADKLNFLRYAQTRGLSLYAVKDERCPRITVFTKFIPETFRPIYARDRYVIHEFKIRGHLPILMGFVHFLSKMYANEEDQSYEAEILRDDIERSEQRVKHKNTVIVGDFNMNPFETGMVSAKALHAHACLITAQLPRTRQGETHHYFYNPSWNLLGDRETPPGTLFYRSSNLKSYDWNLLDQVILRPELGDYFDKDSLAVLTDIGSATLLTKQGRPSAKFSDHLPITFTLRTR